MCMSIVSIRVNKRVKEVLERFGINISQVVKAYLEELAWRVELRERVQKLNELLEEMPPAESGLASKSVREDREGH